MRTSVISANDENIRGEQPLSSPPLALSAGGLPEHSLPALQEPWGAAGGWLPLKPLSWRPKNSSPSWQGQDSSTLVVPVMPQSHHLCRGHHGACSFLILCLSFPSVSCG